MKRTRRWLMKEEKCGRGEGNKMKMWSMGGKKRKEERGGEFKQ